MNDSGQRIVDVLRGEIERLREKIAQVCDSRIVSQIVEYETRTMYNRVYDYLDFNSWTNKGNENA